jgi:hypothetical protein
MLKFHIVVRDCSGVLAEFQSLSVGSAAAEDAARDLFEDVVVGISVRPA